MIGRYPLLYEYMAPNRTCTPDMYPILMFTSRSAVSAVLIIRFTQISRNMIGQSKISSFFKRTTVDSVAKRPMSSIENDQQGREKSPSKKKVKVDEVATSGRLSPEQKQRMESKKTEALMKLKNKKILQKAPPGFGISWANALEPEFNKEYFKKLQDFVGKERSKGTVYPPEHEVFTWTQQCDIHDVKVVILGQDPYHGPGQAHGLCFSVVKGVRPPPSLQNMFKELTQDEKIADFTHPGHGDLNGWAQQGVLLLNAVLTVRAHQANSHKDKGWEKFTDAVISWLNKNLDDVVFMLWGSYAQKKGSVINSKRHHVLKAVHPSPLSAHRGFFGCQHFSKANTFLKSVGKKPIDWTKL